jgi:sortase A
MVWGSVFMMLVGGIVAYPTLRTYIAPPDALSLEFEITLTPAAVVPSPPATTPTPPPPVLLPETELVTPAGQETPEAQTEATVVPTASAEVVPTVPPPAASGAIFDPASFVPNRMVIPAINLDAPVVAVGWEAQEVNGKTASVWVVPDSFAVGWHENSAWPGLGGNIVFNGHHNVHGEVFRDLENLQPGDEIIVYVGETAHYYGVTARRILEEKDQPDEVREQNASCILPTDYERLTLVTCWPYTDNTHRLVIIALPIQPATDLMPR